jgi:hypothetical protein
LPAATPLSSAQAHLRCPAGRRCGRGLQHDGDEDDRRPLSTALGSPYFLAIATGEGMLHPWKDYEAALRDVGFKQTVRLDKGLPIDHVILVGIK